MIVYVETNFVLELALWQDEHDCCEEIATLAEDRQIELVVPAYSLVEPYETLRRRHADRMHIAQETRKHAKLLARSSQFEASVSDLNTIDRVFRESTSAEDNAFEMARTRIVECATVLPLSEDVVMHAAKARGEFGFTGQDSIVFASVLQDLARQPGDEERCFINRNPKDFDNPSVIEALRTHRCKLLSSFAAGLGFLTSQLNARKSG